MKEKVTIKGRSLLFNSLFVLFNLLGVVFITLGFHTGFEEQAILFKLMGVILIISSIGGMVVFKGRLLMASVSRVLVGGLFIVSGLVKANDPAGFAYKLEEYFEDGALAFRIKELFNAPEFSLEFFMDYALLLSVIICVAEIILGVLIIIGGKVKIVAYSMLLMMVFFSFLTWHTSNCDSSVKFLDRDTYEMTNPIAQIKIDQINTNKDNPDYDLKIVSQSETSVVIDEMKQPQCVDDCGCFGDAMKGSVGRSLTPIESFWKDLILVYLILWIFISTKRILPNTREENKIFIPASLFVILFFSWIFSWYFPFFFGITTILGSLWVIKYGGKIFGNYYGVAFFVTIISMLMIGYVLLFLPLKDYRAYAVGSDLKEKMSDGIEGVYENLLVYKNKINGEEKEFLATSSEYNDSKIWEDEDWEYLSMAQKVIIPTKIPSITDQFNPFIDIYDLSEYEKSFPSVNEFIEKSSMQGVLLKDLKYDGEIEVPLNEFNTNDYDTSSYAVLDTITMMDPSVSEVSIRDFIVNTDKIVLIFSQNLLEGDWRNIDDLKAIFEECQSNGIPFAVVCNGSRPDIITFREENKFYAPFFVNDETELKAICRSNPALIIIEKGIVKAKYPFRSTPNLNVFKKKHL